VVSTEPDAPCNKEGEGPKQFCGWVKEIFSFTVYMKSFIFIFNDDNFYNIFLIGS